MPLRDVPTKRLFPHPSNRWFSTKGGGHDDNFEELKRSIQHQGIMTPLLIRPMAKGTYQIISGHRRHYIAAHSKFPTVPCVVTPMTDREALDQLLLANALHRALCGMEWVDAVEQLRKAGRDLTTISNTLGRPPAWTKRVLIAAKLPMDVKERARIGRWNLARCIRKAALLEEFTRLEFENAPYLIYTRARPPKIYTIIPIWRALIAQGENPLEYVEAALNRGPDVLETYPLIREVEAVIRRPFADWAMDLVHGAATLLLKTAPVAPGRDDPVPRDLDWWVVRPLGKNGRDRPI